MKEKKIKGRHRHAFRFKVEKANGTTQEFECWADVIFANKSVTLSLKAEHVRESIRRKGVGNTQTCSMAVCASREEDRFPHPVEGYIDWQYSRAYVVSKLDKTGLPCECVAYRHYDEIARLNDSKGGQQKLLAQLEKYGDREIYLHSMVNEMGVPRIHLPSKNTGNRKSRAHTLKGSKLRFAVAQLGSALAP